MLEQNYSGREKRRHKRVERRFVVTILPAGDDSEPWDIVDLENISEGGILFNHNKKLEEGTILNIRIKVLQNKDAIQCAGRVMHAQKLGGLGLYEYGISFTQLKDEDRVFLRQSLAET